MSGEGLILTWNPVCALELRVAAQWVATATLAPGLTGKEA